jgi:probable rRNA maturation factor
LAIEVVNRQRLCRVDARRAKEVAQATLEAISRAKASLAVAFVRDRAIRDLNQRYRNKDQATDVLSFPSEGEPQERSESLIEKDNYLGDIVISTDTALRQAREAHHSVEREFDELVLHGVLHLCGYDHETDRGEMNRLELQLRRKLLRS